MSHLACSDDPGAAMNADQLSRFRTALAMLPPAPASLAASGGGCFWANPICSTWCVPASGFTAAIHRRGMGKNPMQTAAILTSRILQLRRIDKGEEALATEPLIVQKGRVRSPPWRWAMPTA